MGRVWNATKKAGSFGMKALIPVGAVWEGYNLGRDRQGETGGAAGFAKQAATSAGMLGGFGYAFGNDFWSRDKLKRLSDTDKTKVADLRDAMRGTKDATRKAQYAEKINKLKAPLKGNWKKRLGAAGHNMLWNTVLLGTAAAGGHLMKKRAERKNANQITSSEDKIPSKTMAFLSPGMNAKRIAMQKKQQNQITSSDNTVEIKKDYLAPIGTSLVGTGMGISKGMAKATTIGGLKGGLAGMAAGAIVGYGAQRLAKKLKRNYDHSQYNALHQFDDYNYNINSSEENMNSVIANIQQLKDQNAFNKSFKGALTNHYGKIGAAVAIPAVGAYLYGKHKGAKQTHQAYNDYFNSYYNDVNSSEVPEIKVIAGSLSLVREAFKQAGKKPSTISQELSSKLGEAAKRGINFRKIKESKKYLNQRLIPQNI